MTNDDPTTFTVPGMHGFGHVAGTLLAGEIAFEAVYPCGRDGQEERVTLPVSAEESIRFGEWLIAAGRVSRDLADGTLRKDSDHG